MPGPGQLPPRGMELLAIMRSKYPQTRSWSELEQLISPFFWPAQFMHSCKKITDVRNPSWRIEDPPAPT